MKAFADRVISECGVRHGSVVCETTRENSADTSATPVIVFARFSQTHTLCHTLPLRKGHKLFNGLRNSEMAHMPSKL
jgi:hypothetical protein